MRVRLNGYDRPNIKIGKEGFMFKKLIKQIKNASRGSSERKNGHYRKGSSSERHKSYYKRGSSSSSNRHKRNPLGGSSYYKRKGRSSS